MARARRPLSPNPSSLFVERNKSIIRSNESNEGQALDLEDGEITDEETKVTKATSQADLTLEASITMSTAQPSPSQTPVLEPKPPSNPIKEASPAETQLTEIETPTSDSIVPRALSEEELDLAKNIVLDLLGWGVQPEYLIECGVSSHAIYRIFTDLHLRLPSNLSYFGEQ